MRAWLPCLDAGPAKHWIRTTGHNAHLQLFGGNYEGMQRNSPCACRVTGYGDPHCKQEKDPQAGPDVRFAQGGIGKGP